MVDSFFERNKKKLGIGSVVFLLLFVVAVIPVIVVYSNKPSKTEPQPPPVKVSKDPFDLTKLKADEKDRINCFLEEESPFEKLTEYQCKEVRKCLYKESSMDRVPTCYFDRQNLGYKLKGTGPTSNSYLLEGNRDKAPYLGTIKNILLKASYLGNNILRVKITDNDNDRYEVPYPLNLPQEITDPTKSVLEFKLLGNLNEISSFQVLRRNGNDILFDSTNGAFVYNDQFIQISTNLIEGSSIYGFGENNHESLKHDLNYRSWGMFGRDNAPGWGENRNNYGFQPVYLVMEPSGKSHLVLLYNSNAMEYLFTPKPSLTLRTIGGILDFYFITDETPEKVLQHYHNLIGLPVLPPYWSFGFQICRWGYEKLQDVKDVVDRTRLAKIPHDVQYIDIEYMIGYRILTLDKVNFNGTRQYQQELAKNGVRLVLIVDPGLVMENNNTLYVDGYNSDIYVKWPKYLTPYDIDARGDDAMISWCWPNGKITYPDYMNEKTHEWWKRSIKYFSESETEGTDLDGIWIDMNEPSSFETNELKPWNWLYPEDDQDKYPYFSLKCPTNKYDDPPYRTKNAFKFDDSNLLAPNKKARLSQKTLCMIALHNKDNKQYYHYDVHNLYGHSQAIASYKAMLHAKPGLRPFVLTRSNFVGTGAYSFHWSGDNDATWQHMRMSIINLVEYNIFGIPMIGSDICGFFISIQDVEMCTRWLQLGAFYTFSRNHNANKQIEKDPVSYNSQSLIDSTINVLKIRYSILPHMYTLFFNVHNKGGSVIRPLFFEFPNDKETVNIQEQFLLGSSLLVSPVLYNGKRDVNAYLPNQTKWYDFRKGMLIEKLGWQNLAAPLDYINLHVRGGIVIPMQEPEECLTTVCSRKKPLQLLITLDENKKASGELFWDDGVSLINSANPNYHFIEFNYENNKFNSVIKTQGSNVESLNFETIKIYGLDKNVNQVLINSKPTNNFAFDSVNKVLTVKEVGQKIDTNFVVDFVF